MTTLDLVGWAGSVLLVLSVLQARVVRFRVLNLIACAVLVAFNAVLGVWPMVAVNVVLCAINVWFLIALVRTRHDAATYEVIEVSPHDEYLRHVLRVHGADILRFNPAFVHDPFDGSTLAFLVQRGDETVGVVLVQAHGEVATIALDYVTPRFRDFSPGEFVWHRSDLLTGHGIRRVQTGPEQLGDYYRRVSGFERLEDRWVLELA